MAFLLGFPAKRDRPASDLDDLPLLRKPAGTGRAGGDARPVGGARLDLADRGVHDPLLPSSTGALIPPAVSRCGGERQLEVDGAGLDSAHRGGDGAVHPDGRPGPSFGPCLSHVWIKEEWESVWDASRLRGFMGLCRGSLTGSLPPAGGGRKFKSVFSGDMVPREKHFAHKTERLLRAKG